jgi:hypothetical protein
MATTTRPRPAPNRPAASPTKTIRVRAETHERLQAMAGERQQSIGTLLDELMEERTRNAFWAQMAEAYRRLRADPEASAAYDAEIALWDNTLLDGLDDESWDGAFVEES